MSPDDNGPPKYEEEKKGEDKKCYQKNDIFHDE